MIAVEDQRRRMPLLPASTDQKDSPVRNQVFPSSDIVREELTAMARRSLAQLPASFPGQGGDPDLTIAVLSHNRAECTIDAIRALYEHVVIPFQLLVVDNASDATTRQALRAALTEYDSAKLMLLDENLGCAGGRMFALDHVRTRFLMLLDNDVTVLPGAVDHLMFAMSNRPDAVAATGRLYMPDGRMHLFGGRFSIVDGLVQPELSDFGLHYGQPTSPSGLCDWVPGGMTIFRTAVLDRHRYDPMLGSYYEDVEWCLRVKRQNEGVFIRCAESLAIHYHEAKQPSSSLPPRERFPRVLPYLNAIAHLYRNCGIWIPAVFVFLPELGPPAPLGVDAAKLMLELLSARGDEWFVRAWSAGELTVLFGPGRSLRLLKEKEAQVVGLTEQLTTHREKINTLIGMYAERQRAVDRLISVVQDLEKTANALGQENAILQQSFASRLLRFLRQLFS